MALGSRPQLPALGPRLGQSVDACLERDQPLGSALTLRMRFERPLMRTETYELDTSEKDTVVPGGNGSADRYSSLSVKNPIRAAKSTSSTTED